MKYLFKKMILMVFALLLFLTAGNVLAISNLVCVQVKQNINCSLKTDQISKPSIDTWLSNQENSITVKLLSGNKIIGSNLSYKSDDYFFDIPISYLKSQGIAIPGNVNFNAKIYKSGPGSDPNMVYLDSDTSQITINDTATTSETTAKTKTNESATTKSDGTSTNTNNKSAVTGTGATSTSQKDYFNKFLNISKNIGNVDGPTTVSGIVDIFLIIMQWIFAFALMLGIIMVIISGISYMTAGGESDRVNKATKVLTYSVIGVAIALISSFVIQIIRNLLS